MSRKIFLLLLLLLAAVLFASITLLAQDQVEPSCTVENWQSGINELGLAISEVSSQITTEQEGWDTLLSIEIQIENARATCGGGEFTSEAYPNGIIGPVSFSGTLYQITLNSEGGGASYRTTVIDGDCETLAPTSMTTDSRPSETDLWEPGGDCIAMFEVNTFGASSWTLTFDRLR